MSDAPTPDPRLRALDKLVGTWTISGQGEGEATYEWMEGGFFPIQRGELEQEETSVQVPPNHRLRTRPRRYRAR